MNYSEFEKAIQTLGLCAKVSYDDLKSHYRELSKVHHPDRSDGDAVKFDAITKAYKLLKTYMESYRFSLDKEEFQNQHPSILNMKDWLSGNTRES
ncbi:MAG: J domain-containing protein [Sulfurospirillum sp.]|nr:J domain-containing protein [Sulfurospirillum sp.]